MNLRILYADDEPLARQRLADLLGNERDIEVVAVCNDGEEAAQAAATP